MQRWILPPDAVSADGLLSEQSSVPEPGTGQVRIQVRAISINARDMMIIAGPFGRAPGESFVPLSDVAGRLDAIGDSVEDWSIGNRVMTAHAPEWRSGAPRAFGTGPGSAGDPGVASEYIIVDAARLIRTPDDLDDIDASTLQVAGVTAWNAVFSGRQIGAGDSILIVDAGVVAVFAAQLAIAVGAKVYVANRGTPDLSRWSAIDIAALVSSDDDGWAQSVFDLSGGVTKVINTIGPGTVNDLMPALEGGGEIAVVGLRATDSPELDAWTLIGKQISVRGVAVGSVAMHADLAAFLVEHAVKPVIRQRIPFDDLPAAYAARTPGAPIGNVVIAV